MENNHNIKIYICYAEKDEKLVKNIYNYLKKYSFEPWMISEDILPGQKIHNSIEAAIQLSDFFIICLSTNLISNKGNFHKELKQAFEILDCCPEEDIYIIPILIEECPIPLKLLNFQPLNLYNTHNLDKLINTITIYSQKKRLKNNKIEGLPKPKKIIDDPFKIFFYKLQLSYNFLIKKNFHDFSLYIYHNLSWLAGTLLTEIEKTTKKPSERSKIIVNRINNPEIFVLIKEIHESCRVIMRSFNENEIRIQSSEIIGKFMIILFWFNFNIFSDSKQNKIEIRRILNNFQNPENLKTNNNKHFFLSGIDTFTDTPKSSQSANKKVYIHRISHYNTNGLSEYQKILSSAIFIALKRNYNINYLKKNVLKNKILFLCYSIDDDITIILSQISTCYIIIYIGNLISLDTWFNKYSIITNNVDYFEIIKKNCFNIEDVIIKQTNLKPEKYEEIINQISKNDESISEEIKENVLNSITDQTLQKYKNINKKSSGMIQSNLALLNNDKDLRQALQFPIDSWRLYLHPKQKEIVYSNKKTIFIHGGPGTGKTVVIAHRMCYFYRHRSQKLKQFKILFFSFTQALAKVLRDMLRKLDIPLDDRIFITDMIEFREKCKKGLIKINITENGLFFHENNKSQYKITDIFFDEFQDFPTKNYLNNYFINLLKNAQYHNINITCTFDENQAILHTETDMKIWKDTLLPDYYDLSYCYRLAKEINEISFEHKKIMLEHTKAVFFQQNNSEQTISFKKPIYAFSGGSVTLIPTLRIKQFENLELVLSKILLRKYSLNDICIIFFDNKTDNDDTISYQWRISKRKHFKEKYNLPIYNPAAVKGLEYKAGIILFPHNVFINYYEYLEEGMELRNLDNLCKTNIVKASTALFIMDITKNNSHMYAMAKINRLNSVIDNITDQSIDKLKLIKEIQDICYIFEFQSFFNTIKFSKADIKIINKPSDQIRDFELLELFDLNTLKKIKEWKMHKINNIHTFLKSLSTKFLTDIKISIQERDFMLKNKNLNDLLIYLAKLQIKLKKIHDETNKQRFQLFKKSCKNIEESERIFNEFYVALTRFRENAFLIYDKTYDLVPILPGASTIKNKN